MPRTLDPFRLLLFAVAGWMNHQQQQVIDYLREENRILHAQLGTRRLRFDDDQRRRLAVRAKLLGRRVLAEVATIVTPDTLLRWHRKLIAGKYDGSAKRGPGRPTGNRLITPQAIPTDSDGTIQRRQRLGRHAELLPPCGVSAPKT